MSGAGATGALVALKVAPAATITGPVGEVPVVVTVSPAEGAERMPVDICCVLDISWSMSMEAKVQGSAGTVESNGLSMLDIAKHAVRTIIRSVDAKDRVSIVQFCREAEIKLPMTEMNEAGQKKAEEVLDEIGFGSATNLWAGIELGLQCLTMDKDDPNKDKRMGHMILLTDGEVTEGKELVMPNIRKFKQQHEKLPGTICVFGFGYEIDSPMLVEIADFCDGSYAFIPDAGFVGTCFVNAISNLQVTMARDAILSIQADPDSEAEILGVLGGWDAEKRGDGTVSISLGTLQYGQTKDIVVRMKIKSASEPYLFAAVEYGTLAGRFKAEVEAKPPGDPEEAMLAEIHNCRSLVIDALREAVKAVQVAESTEETLKKGQDIVREVVGQIISSSAVDTKEVKALLEDVQGQCTEALSRTDFWQKWGRHYIPSVVSAHKLQQCNNFKDPGVQVYGSELFEAMQDAADGHFNSLPAPKVTPATYRYLGGGKIIHNPAFRPAGAGAAAPPRAAPAQSMAAYNDRYAGCIDGEAQVALAGGGVCRVAGLAKGDRVLSGLGAALGESAEVVCLVRSRCRGGRALLTEIPPPCGAGADGASHAAAPLRLTPHHPVHVDGEFRFPVDLGHTEERECEAVYSFVLRGAPAALVESTPCVALGHGLGSGAAAHPYLASPRVLEDLQALPGYDAGMVELLPEDVVRDTETGLICGLRRAPLAA